MKNKVLYIMLLFAALMSACSNDNELPEPAELISTTTVSATQTSGTGEGTAASPAVATAETPAEITLSQKSTYKDPNGSTFECEPRATTKLSTAQAAIHAKTLAELTAIKESSSTTTEGTNPVTKHTVQTFTIGGQTLTFDLQHEIYTYTDSKQRTVEMPYIRLANAHHGAAQTEETRASRPIAVTGIRLTPLSTRGTVTTEQAYHVSVDFTVETQTENTDDVQNQTLSFTAEYDATVETVTEYPDPTLDFSYHAHAIHGTKSSMSPWIMKDGMKQMTIQWDAQATYTYFDTIQMATQVVSCEPKATASIQLAADTVWVKHKDELQTLTATEPIMTTEGENPLKNIGKASFTVGGGHIIDVDWNYESYPAVEIEGEEIALPCIVLGKPEVQNVTCVEVEKTSINGQDAKVFEVTAKIKQNLSTVNVPEDQRVSQDVQYIVRYIGVMEVELVDVKYRKEYEWLEPHDNIPLASHYILYRDRTYSTGEVFTDVFTSMNCAVEGSFVITIRGGETDQLEDKEVMIPGDVPILYHKNNYTLDQERRQYCLNTTKTGVPDLSKLSLQVCVPEEYSPVVPGDFENYHLLGGGLFSEDTQEAWYFRDIGRWQRVDLYYLDKDPNLDPIRCYNIAVRFYDRFLYLDGQIFDFLDYKMTYDFDFREEDITMPNGAPAKVFTHEIKAKYLGRDFYVAEIDTVYQRNFQP